VSEVKKTKQPQIKMDLCYEQIVQNVARHSSNSIFSWGSWIPFPLITLQLIPLLNTLLIGGGIFFLFIILTETSSELLPSVSSILSMLSNFSLKSFVTPSDDNEESIRQSFETSTQQHTIDADGSNSRDVQLLPIPILEDDTTDEWGQFVDFHEDHPTLISSSSFSYGSPKTILADPFQSLIMAVLRLRDDMMPFCKLERLAEEEF